MNSAVQIPNRIIKTLRQFGKRKATISAGFWLQFSSGTAHEPARAGHRVGSDESVG
jgi:hypothetical protein